MRAWMTKRSTALEITKKPEEAFPDINTVIWQNDVHMLRYILKKVSYEDLSKPNAEGCIHLHQAAYYGFFECLRVLVYVFSDDINRRTKLCQTPLFLAVAQSNVECVELLLKNGADPNIPDISGESPLYKACELNNDTLVELLLQSGSNARRTTNKGLTPLHEAARNRNLAMCRLLKVAGGKIYAKSSYGVEPLFTAAQGGCPEVVKYLIRHGAIVNGYANDGATPLYEASKNGHEEVVKLLLSKKANADERTIAGLTPLHIAAKNGHAGVVSLLIPHTNLTSIYRCGISPLHLAAEFDEEEILEMLIRTELDVNALLSPEKSTSYEDRRSTALYFTVSQNNYDTASMLLAAGANPNLDMFNPLLVAVRRGDRGMVSLLLGFGANVNACIPTHPTTFPGALLFCINNISMLKLLLDNGCDAEACFFCIYGDNPHPQFKSRRTTGHNLYMHDDESPHPRAAQFCETLADPFYSPWAGRIIDLLLDYVGQVKLCSKLTELLDSNKEWAYIKEKTRPPFSLMHLSRLRIHQLVGRQRLRRMSSLPLPGRLIKYLLYDRGESGDFLYYSYD
ncbi:ankyrin repeat and SOCS box protein 2-like [Alosa pseudoharengus]|uniref:ankyrin repeat and SOCS box protein 2-like n=1 Tax=Alosa pseudoharengus TaxID=34774 RepID=UPI003F8AE361